MLLLPTFRVFPHLVQSLIVKHPQLVCAPLIRAVSISRIPRQTMAEARYRATTLTASRVEMNRIDENIKVPKIKLIYAKKTAAKLRQADAIPSSLSSKSILMGFADGSSHVFQFSVFFRVVF